MLPYIDENVTTEDEILYENMVDEFWVIYHKTYYSEKGVIVEKILENLRNGSM